MSGSLTGFRWSLSLIEGYARDPRACDLAAIRAAIRRYEYEEALARTFARVVAKQPITTNIMIEVLPYSCFEAIFTISLIALTEGDRARVLVEAAERNRFPEDELGATMRALVLHAAWILEGQAYRERIATQAHRMSTRWRGGHSDRNVLTSLIEALLRDTRPGAAPTGRGEHAISHDLVLLQWALTSPREDIEEALLRAIDPDEPASGVGLDLIPAVATAPPKAGRNEPCPCGSGRKYKKCHGADGDSRPTVLAISGADVREMAFRDLAGLDLSLLSDDALAGAFLRFIERPAWPLVGDAMEQLAARPGTRGRMDDRRAVVIQTAVAARRYDIAQREQARLSPGYQLPAVARCALALQARATDALDQLWGVADLAVRDEALAHDFELAMILIHLVPALGLLVARGVHVEDEWMAEVLANKADEGRAELGLPAGDRLRQTQAALRRDKVHGGELEASRARATELRAALEGSLERTHELERRIRVLEEELRQRPPAAEPRDAGAAADPTEVRALRGKVEDLQEMIRERNASIAGLRRKLEEATGAAGLGPARPPRPPAKRR